jgi:DNA-binding SARP family transcriptional activator
MKLVCQVYKVVLCFVVIFTLSKNKSSGQSYGLAFSSHEVFQDKRTGLDLTPQKSISLKGDFGFSFDMSFLPNYHVYFGYLLRIIEDDKRNIDLIYDQQAKSFNIIVGDKLSKIIFDIDSVNLYHNWNKIDISFDVVNDKLVLTCGKMVMTQSGLHLKKNCSYKFMFGVNNYNQFQTTDTPPIKVRDIRITENGQLKYNWPLNEDNGVIAHEQINQQDGVVDNPKWVTAMHHDWQFEKSFTVKGVASVAFDELQNNVYLLGADSVYCYHVATSKWSSQPHRAGIIELNKGNQSAYNRFNHRLYNIFPDLNFVSGYNAANNTWDKKFLPGPVTDQWQLNKFFSSTDTALYLLGGYGHLRYKNKVLRYSLNSGKWTELKPKGDFFMPRYIAALGSTAQGDTAYILGGYGNSSGQQILNPKNMYDMMRFSVKDQSFKKMFVLKPKGEDFALANSLILDEGKGIYYGLIFPQHKYNSSLRLMKGSLKGPDYELMGNEIPYNFHDVHSFVDLYYSPSLEKFIVVTLLLSDEGVTKVNVYTLLGPPAYNQQPIIKAVDNKYWYFAIAGVLVALSAGYFIIRKKATVAPLPPLAPVLGTEPVKPLSIPEIQQMEMAESQVLQDYHQYKNTILLFGDLHVFDATGVEITKLFTPLVKELFLIILLNSIRWGRGMSQEKLNEILWNDKSAKSARNNCSVNIAKLKALLDRMGNYHLSNETGYWKIDLDYQHIQVDYYQYLQLVKNKNILTIQKFKSLFDITQRGNFLSNLEYEWLDTFKSQVSNDVVDTYLQFAHAIPTLDPDFVIELADCIFYFDPVNEDAMIMKCKALHALGKHSLAKSTFESFTKEYKVLYDEIFKKDFHAILE